VVHFESGKGPLNEQASKQRFMSTTSSLRSDSQWRPGVGLAGLFALVVLGIAAGESRAQGTPDYNLQPGDQIEVSVWGEDELQREILLRPDGRFAFPLAGEIAAAGRTAADIQTELTEKLVAYIPEAVVTVSVTGIQGNQIYVIGQVQRPGGFVMNPQISVLQALSLAGGTTAFAALNDIIVIRGSGQGQRVHRFAYDDIKRGRNLDQNIQLETGDVVVVP
jgi:polysaccharide export outer membrane protein